MTMSVAHRMIFELLVGRTAWGHFEADLGAPACK